MVDLEPRHTIPYFPGGSPILTGDPAIGREQGLGLSPFIHRDGNQMHETACLRGLRRHIKTTGGTRCVAHEKVKVTMFKIDITVRVVVVQACRCTVSHVAGRIMLVDIERLVSAQQLGNDVESGALQHPSALQDLWHGGPGARGGTAGE